jgi:hypothetical protein
VLLSAICGVAQAWLAHWPDVAARRVHAANGCGLECSRSGALEATGRSPLLSGWSSVPEEADGSTTPETVAEARSVAEPACRPANVHGG